MYMRGVMRVRTCVRRSLALRRRGGRKSCGGVGVMSARVYWRREVDEIFGAGSATRAWCCMLRCRGCLDRVTCGGDLVVCVLVYWRLDD